MSLFPDRQYYRIKQDDQMPKSLYSRPTPPPCPAVFRLEPYSFTKMDERLQRFWFGLNNVRPLALEIKAWVGYTNSNTAFCNGSWGVNKCADYISRKRLLLKYPKMGNLVCAGNVLCGTETIAYGIYGIPNGTKVLQVETIDPRNYPDYQMTHKTHPHLIHVADIIYPTIAPNGLMTLNAFPQRGGRMGYPVYYPVWADTPRFYRLDMLDKLRQGDPLPSVYNPA